MTPLQIWTAAARPRTLFAAAAPVLLGTALAYADGGAHGPSALVALACALLLQIGANFVNDLADFEKGADTKEGRIGPLRVVSAGLVAPATMRRAVVFTFALAFVLGLYLVARGGWPILAVGLASIAAAVAYTAGKNALAYLGLGDLFVLIFFGPVAVAGTHYVQTLQFSWPAVLAGIGPGLIAVAILVANNLRDVQGDRAAGKRTLIVRFGGGFGKALFAACYAGAALVPVAYWLWTGRHPGAMAAAWVLPMAIPLLKTVFATHPETDDPKALARTLIPVLGRTGQLLFVYAVLFSLGVALT